MLSSLSRGVPAGVGLACSTARAMGAHSSASDQRTPSLAAIPLMSTVERPTRTRSCAGGAGAFCEGWTGGAGAGGARQRGKGWCNDARDKLRRALLREGLQHSYG